MNSALAAYIILRLVTRRGYHSLTASSYYTVYGNSLQLNRMYAKTGNLSWTDKYSKFQSKSIPDNSTSH